MMVTTGQAGDIDFSMILGAFAIGVASQQGALTLLATWFLSPCWDLLV